MPGPDLLDKLRAIDTPTICNVIELFDLRPRTGGYMDARIQACFPELPPFVGYAATATYRSSAPPRQGDVYAGLFGQVSRFGELDGPAVVVFQDLDSPSVAATFGEQMCRTYLAFGSVGLITSGAGRDLEQVRELRYPCFAGGRVCAHGYCHVLHVHVPVHVGGIVVYPNDLLHGDANGVTTIPREVADQIPDAAHEFLAAEALLVNALSGGTPTLDILRQAMSEKEAAIQALRKRLSRAQAL